MSHDFEDEVLKLIPHSSLLGRISESQFQPGASSDGV